MLKKSFLGLLMLYSMSISCLMAEKAEPFMMIDDQVQKTLESFQTTQQQTMPVTTDSVTITKDKLVLALKQSGMNDEQVDFVLKRIEEFVALKSKSTKKGWTQKEQVTLAVTALLGVVILGIMYYKYNQPDNQQAHQNIQGVQGLPNNVPQPQNNNPQPQANQQNNPAQAQQPNNQEPQIQPARMPLAQNNWNQDVDALVFILNNLGAPEHNNQAAAQNQQRYDVRIQPAGGIAWDNPELAAVAERAFRQEFDRNNNRLAGVNAVRQAFPDLRFNLEFNHPDEGRALFNDVVPWNQR